MLLKIAGAAVFGLESASLQSGQHHQPQKYTLRAYTEYLTVLKKTWHFLNKWTPAAVFFPVSRKI